MRSPAEIAVIIPAYNAAATLPSAVASIRRQTFQNLEVWVVDDGSCADDTGHVADSLTREEPRLRVIHQPNRGGYLARLRATRMTQAPWIGFVDADDEVEPEMYAKLHAFATAERLDVAQCEQVGCATRAPECFLGKDQCFRSYVWPCLFQGAVASFMWDKLYRNRGFSSFKALPILMFDDLAFNLQFFVNVDRIGILHEGLYHYNINAASSVRNYRRKNLEDFLAVVRFRREIAPRYGLNPNDSVFDAWVVKNARNQFVVAATAPVKQGERRGNNLRAIVSAAEVVAARRRVSSGGGGNSARGRLLSSPDRHARGVHQAAHSLKSSFHRNSTPNPRLRPGLGVCFFRSSQCDVSVHCKKRCASGTDLAWKSFAEAMK